MKPDGTIPYESPYVFFNPVYVWKCTFAHGLFVANLTAGQKVPNRFHRWMHKLILGIVWERIGDEK